MNIVSIIPARGGSVRVPRKNLLPLCGLPLIAWTVKASVASRLINDSYVVTDSEEIAEVSQKHGAKIIWQSKWQADTAVHYGGTVAFLVGMDEAEKIQPVDIWVNLFCTTPLRKPDDIDNAIRQFMAHPYCSRQLSMSRRVEQVLWEDIGDGMAALHVFEKNPHLLADVSGLCTVTTARYLRWMSEWQFSRYDIDHPMVHVGNQGVYLVEQWQGYDIDTTEDFDIVKVLFEQKIFQEMGADVYERYAADGDHAGTGRVSECADIQRQHASRDPEHGDTTLVF